MVTSVPFMLANAPRRMSQLVKCSQLVVVVVHRRLPKQFDFNRLLVVSGWLHMVRGIQRLKDGYRPTELIRRHL